MMISHFHSHTSVKSEKKLLCVGQVVSTHLYGWGRGIVFGIHGEQSPMTVSHSGGGVIARGGSAVFDIVFHGGKICRGLSESILHGIQWQIGDDVCSQDDIDRLLGVALLEEKKWEQAKQDKKTAFDAEVERLENTPEYSHLKKIDDNRHTSAATVVSANIRIELKKCFPGVKFSVRKTSFDAVTVRWEDGPQIEKVECLTRRFKDGHFNSMEDIFDYNESPFNVVFGGIHYISVERQYSDDLISHAIDKSRERFGHQVPERVNVEAYRKGQLMCINSTYFGNNSLQHEIRMILNSL